MPFTAKNFLWILLITILTVFSTVAQNTTIDSLNHLVNNAKEDTIKVNTLHSLAIQYKNSDPVKYKDYLDKAYTLAVKLNYKKGIVNNLLAFGDLAYKQGNFEKVLSLLGRAKEIAKEIKDTVNIASCLNRPGIIYVKQGFYEKAIDHFNESLALWTAIKDLMWIGHTHNNLGNAYMQKGDFEQALKHYFQALDFYEKSNNNGKIPVVLMNIGNIYSFQKDYLKAIDYYQQSLKNNSDKVSVAMAYSNIGEVYMYMKKFDKADENFNISLKLAEEQGSKSGIASVLSNLGMNCINTGKLEKAMEYHFKSLQIAKELNDKKLISEITNNISRTYQELKDFKRSLEYGEKGLLLAKEIGAKEVLKNSYESLSETYTKLADYEKALENYKLSVEIKDSIFSTEKTRSIAELQTRYETDKKEKEIQLLIKNNLLKEKELKAQRTIRLSLLAGLSLLFILAFTLYNRYRFKQKANLLLENQKKEIQLKNMQITDSIDYAKTIQEAILPSDKTMHALFPDSFILHQAKDVVSGDFYWVGEKDHKLICAVVDCTGHGVPGAFMSLLGNNILENLIKKTSTIKPSSILYSLNEEILRSLTNSKEGSSPKNGMDIALITFDKKSRQLQYSGAQHPLYLIRDGELSEVKADRISIGSSKEIPFEFTNHTLELKKNDLIYLFSDGFPDQIGGPNRKKFYYQPFKELLLSIHKLEMNEQRKSLDQAIINWKGDHEQTDDILVMGIKC
jgi:serine phosphatase RsbU (regulator of sigma subunit)/uncharacterized protein HemY